MNKNIGIVFGVVVLVVIAGGIYASMNNKNDAIMEKEQMEQKVMEDKKVAEEKAMMEQKAMEEKNTIVDKSETIITS